MKAAAKVYTGKALTPAVKVTLSGKTLKKGTDYTVSYRNAAGKAIKATSLKKAATYTIVVKGMGNYKAKATGKFVIKSDRDGFTDVSVFDVFGTEILRTRFVDTIEIDASSWASGVYVVNYGVPVKMGQVVKLVKL